MYIPFITFSIILVSSAIAVISSEMKLDKRDRCKFYPLCGKGDRCEFIHPSAPCKAFPNCKYGDQCLYIHPKCKFDLTCSRLGCNFTHTAIASAAPPICKTRSIVTIYLNLSRLEPHTHSTLGLRLIVRRTKCRPGPFRFGILHTLQSTHLTLHRCPT